MFKLPGKAGIRKQHIRAFYGFDMHEDVTSSSSSSSSSSSNSEERKQYHTQRLDNRCTTDRLKEFAYIFGLERGGTKNELVERIVTFCCRPEPNTKPLPTKVASSNSGKKQSKRQRDDENDNDDDANANESDTVTPVKSSKNNSTVATVVPSSSSTSSLTTSTPTTTTINKPNPAAFALFSREEGPLLVKIYPYLNNRIVEKINILTNLWNALPDNDKQRFGQPAANTASSTKGVPSLTTLSPSEPSSSSSTKRSKNTDPAVSKKKKKVEKKKRTEKSSSNKEDNDDDDDNGDDEDTESMDNHHNDIKEMTEVTHTKGKTEKVAEESSASGVFDYTEDLEKPKHNEKGKNATTVTTTLSSKSIPDEDLDEGQLSDF